MKNSLLAILHKLEADFLILENCDPFAFLHNNSSQLAALTAFCGTAGEAILAKSGEIFLFVDSRYHIQAEKQAKGATVIKVPMGETFIAAIKKIIPKSAKIILDCDISLSKFQKFKKVFPNILTTELPKQQLKLNYNAPLKEIAQDISGESFENKILKLKKIIAKKNAGGFFVTGLEEIAYLTNLRGVDFECFSGFAAKMFVGEKVILFTNHKLPKTIVGLEVQPYLNYKNVLNLQNEKTLFCPSSITYCDFSLIKNPYPIKNNPIFKLMSIKNSCEIEHLKSSFSRLDKALSGFKLKIKAGLSEFELKEILENEIIKNGANALAFKTILAIGENSASIHYCTYDKKKFLKQGDLILLDCGGYYEGGYATDITRVFVCTKASELQKKVYTTVLKAFLGAYYGKEKNCRKIDDIARSFLKTAAPKGFHFGHSLGHGLGISVHQAPPTLSSNTYKLQNLKKNMVVTIEPGLYCENKFGVRLENTVFIDKFGEKKSFSKFEFEANLINEKMLNKNEKKWLKEWQNAHN